MKKRKSFRVTLCLLAILVLVLAACGKSNEETSAGTASDEKPEMDKLKLMGVRDAQISAAQIIAEKKGFFKEEGVDVTNQLIENGPEMGSMIAGGSAPISLMSNFLAITLKASNVPVKVVAVLDQMAGTQAMVGSKNLKLTDAKDLEGLKVGMPNGAEVRYAMDSMGKELGVDVSKIKFINIAPSDGLAALQRGDIDALAAWEPFITKGIEAGGEFVLSGRKSNLPDKKGDVQWLSVHSTMMATDDFLKKNPNTIKALIRGLKKATDFINSNREEAVKILAPELHLTEAELTEIMSRNEYSMEVNDTYWKESNSDGIMDYFMSVGNIKSKPEVKSYNDFSLLKEVYPDLIKSDLK
ncbi:ABC transporter substrate-binding protein [Neobacillus cucumis]|uniref:ABC transporter substrate-binding protein n=1 Tax=Neobacillus cucumis TaxID=1740721 RepID=UPI00203F195B|nr:ABC transporter substrate-binding protein [Neobacillus cucumis]MCM3728650.1 ABC transporter substrate-binding protein [Neobacillus cucumis]